jgi:hypothetical protein
VNDGMMQRNGANRDGPVCIQARRQDEKVHQCERGTVRISIGARKGEISGRSYAVV